MSEHPCRVCGTPAPRRYLTGWCCPRHTPAAFNGRPEDKPDPARTLNGLREAAGLPALKPYAVVDPDRLPMPTERNPFHRDKPSFAELATQQGRQSAAQ